MQRMAQEAREEKKKTKGKITGANLMLLILQN